MDQIYVIGIDYGTDSVRALLVDAVSGQEMASSVFMYPRWRDGQYCDASKQQFRQHPLDYLEGLESVLRDVFKKCPKCKAHLRAISVDATSSTPCLVDERLTPMALLAEYGENPDAMFVLWKDHTSETEARQINNLSDVYRFNYLAYSGGYYSSECFWAKVLHLFNSDESLRERAYGVVELCDWITALLVGENNIAKLKIGRGAAGQKALWSQEWDGYPDREFFDRLDPSLFRVVSNLNRDSFTPDQAAGVLCERWTKMFGLPTDVVVGAGTVDAHACAIGAGVADGRLVASLGTSACFNVVMSRESAPKGGVEGISGEVDGAFIPSKMCYESGMSAFGDVYRWFKGLLEFPIKNIVSKSSLLDDATKQALAAECSAGILAELNRQAMELTPSDDMPLAVEWLNGRRNPYVNAAMRGAVHGLSLGTSAAELFYAFAEATCFGARSIVEHYRSGGVVVDEIIGVGGISLHSPFVMQLLADVTGLEIEVPDGEQMGALGAAMCAAAACGVSSSIESAQQLMKRPVLRRYVPNASRKELFDRRFKRYKQIEKEIEHNENN